VPYTYAFPDPLKADKDGLLAAGGDLSAEALIAAYSAGIFPWYEEDSPLLWWSPERFKISYTLRQTLAQEKYTVRFDHDFPAVIRNCANVKRRNQNGTWITPEMQQAYINLHHQGYAHSVESYSGEVLAGGLYGVSLGRAFFGESMFHLQADASKVALYFLVEQMKKWNFHFIDAQQPTAHLKSLGAEEMPRKEFLERLQRSLGYSTRRGKWSFP
jgi:leucyl/phenylalanyl-tRNA--protein transferase